VGSRGGARAAIEGAIDGSSSPRLTVIKVLEDVDGSDILGVRLRILLAGAMIVLCVKEKEGKSGKE
jgi:hypothetical protein